MLQALIFFLVFYEIYRLNYCVECSASEGRQADAQQQQSLRSAIEKSEHSARTGIGKSERSTRSAVSKKSRRTEPVGNTL
ncbi:hypothetical protein M3Y98_00862300 [Aphelenchoides besseyi]|nr:hypothetical protein M3Y98_00862300 [Aphelenchoides besseyi]